MRQDNFGTPDLTGAMNFSNFVKLLLHILWAIVLVFVLVPNSVEIIRILVGASNG